MEYHFFISFFASLSRAAGFDFLDGKGWKFPEKLFLTYCWVSDIFISFYVFRIISRVFFPISTVQIIEWIPTLLYVGQVFLKSIVLRSKHKKMVTCVERMNLFFEMVNKRDREKYSEIWKNQYSLINRFCKCIFYSQIICLVLAYSPSFYNTFANPSAQFITFPSYYYFYDSHYGFKVTYLVIDYITSNFCCMKTSAVEMLYLTFVSYYISVLRYLKGEIKEIFSEFQKGILDRNELVWWLETHKEIMRQIVIFKELVRSLLLIIYIYNLMNIVTMIMFVTSKGDMEASQKMVAMVVVTVTLFYFFWDCMLTDQLEALHVSLTFEAYSAELSFGFKDLKHAVMFSTSRCRIPLKITAGGVFAPSCWNFKELLTTTSSFLIAMWEVKSRAERQVDLSQ